MLLWEEVKAAPVACDVAMLIITILTKNPSVKYEIKKLLASEIIICGRCKRTTHP